MAATTKTAPPALPATPWGLLPPSLRVLLVTGERRGGAWLAESLSADSACHVVLEETRSAAAGLERLRERSFDVVLIHHAAGELDAFELLDALRGGGAEESLVVLGETNPQEMEALVLEAGADAYVSLESATTRTLLWIIARSTERQMLLRENRRLAAAERQRREQEQGEAQRLLTEQRDLVRDAADETSSAAQQLAASGTPTTADPSAPQLNESLVDHYRELLRAHVIMGSGNLTSEMRRLARLLVDAGITAPQVMQLHVQALEEILRGLGSRSSRHVMTRADLLVLEVLVHVAEQYRLRSAAV